MSTHSRRKAIGLTAAAITMPLSAKLLAEEPVATALEEIKEQNRDGTLEGANRNPQGFQLLPVGSIDLVDGDTMEIYSAFDLYGKPHVLKIKSHSMRVFRAKKHDTGIAFTWSHKGQNGVFKLDRKPQWTTGDSGPVLMVLRDGATLARVYEMIPDFRC